MHTQIAERVEAKPSRRARSTSNQPRKRLTAWQRTQDEMVANIAMHAIEGGRRQAGPDIGDEAAVDAYLEILRRDLIAAATRTA